MTRAKPALAAVVSLVVALGGLPLQAAEFARVNVEFAAPAPVLAIHAPLAAPSLSVSLAASAPIPAQSISALEAAPLIAIPALAPLAKEAPLAAALARPAAEAGPSAGIVLRAMSAPEIAPASGRAFDGALGASAANDVEPVRGGASGSAAASKLAPSSASKAKRPRTTAGRILRAAAVGVGASTLAPLLWAAVPTSGALIWFAVAISPVAAAAALLLAARIVRAVYRRLSRSAPARANAPPTRRVRNTIRAIGFAVGMALAVTTAVNQRPMIEHFHSYVDSRLPAAEREFKTEIPGKFFGDETARVLSQTAEGRAALDRVRGRDGVPRMPSFSVTEARQSAVALPGAAFTDATVKLLSRTAVGREVLDGLRDRGGVVRMPAFFVSYQQGSAAQYTPPDVVFLSVETIEDGGVTVDQFLRDPKAQLDYLEREQAVIVHELKHADQARRSPLNADTWVLLKTNGSRIVSAVEAYVSGRPAAAPSALGASDAAKDEKTAAPVVALADVSAAPVAIDAAEIHRAGFTVRQFVNDPQAQKDYIAAHQAELARALKPAAAAPPVPAGTSKSLPFVPPALLKSVPAPATETVAPRASFSVNFGMIQEWEYEAYITEHFYTHERLTADPGVAMSNDELWGYARGLQDFDGFLHSIDDGKIYSANIHGRSAYYADYLAAQRAAWDAHRVEGYVLLARRDLILHNLLDAREHLDKAKSLAAEKGLPAPALVIPDR